MAQQAPWRDGLAEVRAWCADVRRAARPEGGCGRGDGASRRFDTDRLDAIVARLERIQDLPGGSEKPLRELIGDTPDREIAPGVTGWGIYEDLTRVWTVLVSAPWTAAALTAASGAGSLLGPLGTAI